MNNSPLWNLQDALDNWEVKRLRLQNMEIQSVTTADKRDAKRELDTANMFLARRTAEYLSSLKGK